MEAVQAPRPARRRQQQRSIDTRRRIMEAALSEFARYGFDKVSTRGVALAAGVPHSLVLHYFKSKDELWRDSATHAASLYLRQVFDPDAPATAMSAGDQLRRFFAEYIRFSAEHPDFFRMMTQENTLESDRLVWLMDTHIRGMTKRVTAVIAAAQAEGAVVDGDPLQLLYLFHGVATAPYRSAGELRILTGADPAEPRRVKAHIAMAERLFFR